MYYCTKSVQIRSFFWSVFPFFLLRIWTLFIQYTLRKKFYYQVALREKCLYSEFFWSVFGRILSEYGEIFRIFPYLVRMRKIQTRKTPNTDTFHEVVKCCEIGEA